MDGTVDWQGQGLLIWPFPPGSMFSRCCCGCHFFNGPAVSTSALCLPPCNTTPCIFCHLLLLWGILVAPMTLRRIGQALTNSPGAHWSWELPQQLEQKVGKAMLSGQWTHTPHAQHFHHLFQLPRNLPAPMRSRRVGRRCLAHPPESHHSHHIPCRQQQIAEKPRGKEFQGGRQKSS